MSAVWLLLYLGGIVHLLVLSGFDLKHPASLVVLAPVVAAILLPLWLRRRPSPLPPALLRASGLAGFACALLFVKTVYLEAWDSQDLGSNLAVAGAGLGSLLPALAGSDRPGPGIWLWIGFWLAAGLLDPALPVLGAGLAGMLEGSGLGLGSPAAASAAARKSWPFLLLLGLALPKPWWDFGIERDWAWASGAVGLGAALASCGPVRSRLERLPSTGILGAVGLLAVLYHPALAAAWGLVLGLAAGHAWSRLPHPLPLDRAVPAFLAGLLVSFALHANAWIPGLRNLIWLGNQ